MSEKPKKQHKLYIRFFIVLLTAIVLTLFIISSILYFSFEKISMNQISNNTKENLTKASYSAKLMMDWVTMLTLQIYQDRDIQSILYNVNNDEVSLNISRMRLNGYQAAAPFVQSIYIYNGSSKTIFYDTSGKFMHNKDDFYDQEIIELCEDLQKNNHLLPIPRRIEGGSPLNIDLYKNIYTFVFYENPRMHSSGDNVIVLNISEDWMKNTIESLDLNENGTTFIINSEGRMIISSEYYKMLDDISNQSYISKILESPDESGNFKADFEGIPSLITYKASNDERIDWKFVSVIPYEIIIKDINQMKKITFIIGISILFLGLFFSYIVSKKVYKPIDSIIDKLKKLENEERNSKINRKQEYLRNLIGNTSLDSSEILDTRFKELELSIDSHDNFLLILFKVDCYNSFCDKYNFSDRKLIRFDAMRIISELISELYKNECIDMGNDNIVLITNFDKNTIGNVKDEIENLIKNAQNIIKERLDISLTAVINLHIDSTIEDLEMLYNQAVEASSLRVFSGHGSTIHYNEDIKQKSRDYVYPQLKEKMLIDSLIQRKEESVKSLYYEIIEETQNYSYTSLNFAILRLTLVISATIDNIENSSGINISYNYDDFMVKLKCLETINEINNEFDNFFNKIIFFIKY